MTAYSKEKYNGFDTIGYSKYKYKKILFADDIVHDGDEVSVYFTQDGSTAPATYGVASLVSTITVETASSGSGGIYG